MVMTLIGKYVVIMIDYKEMCLGLHSMAISGFEDGNGCMGIFAGHALLDHLTYCESIERSVMWELCRKPLLQDIPANCYTADADTQCIPCLTTPFQAAPSQAALLRQA